MALCVRPPPQGFSQARCSSKRLTWWPARASCSPHIAPDGRAIAKAVDGATRPGSIYELGGPDVYTFRELMEFTLATIERRRLLLPLPFGVAKLQAAVFELVSRLPLRILSKPLLTRDQVELLRYDNVVSDTARRDGLTLEGLGITPQSIAAIVPTYLWRFRKAGQFRGRLA